MPGDDDLRVTRIQFGGGELAVLSVPSGVLVAPDGLTAVEGEVYLLLVQGLSNREIADVRSTSVRTIENQVAAILRKQGAGSRAELVAQAQR